MWELFRGEALFGKAAAHDFIDADVIFCYRVPEQMAVLGEKCRELKKGCRIVSRRFEIPGLEPFQHVKIKRRFGAESIFIYMGF